MLSDQETAVLDWLASKRDAMVELLAALVNIDSGSYDKRGVDAVGDRISDFLGSHGIACGGIANDRFGDALQARVGNGRAVLLMGHRDTVFGPGEAAARPFQVVGARGYGPGCCDMKAGLVMNAFLLAAFRRFGAPVPVKALFTSDEEIGSPSSRDLIEAEARDAIAAFNAEPGRPNGGIVTGRKGGVFMTIEVTGKAAHAGNNFADGVSAIAEIAGKITELHGLSDPAKGVSCNVGTVSGGVVVNMVAPSAVIGLDLRYIYPIDRVTALAAIERIVAHKHIAGSSAKLTITGEFKPLVADTESQSLFARYAAAATELGQTTSGEFAGGCADSGFAASAGAPTICGVGPIGGRAHSPEEYVELESLVPRAQALALTILRMG